MGLACSDAKKRPSCVPPIKRFCSSFEEISDNSSIAFYTAGDGKVDFVHRRKNEVRKVFSYSHPARLKYYGQTKTRCTDRKIVTSTEQGATQTLTISKLTIKRSFCCEQIGFQKKGDGFECTPECSDRDGTPPWSQTQRETVSSDVFSMSRPSPRAGRGETKSETSESSHSSVSPAKVLEAKHIGTEINLEEPRNSDSLCSLENASNIKVIEIGPLGGSISLKVPGEPTAQLESD